MPLSEHVLVGKDTIVEYALRDARKPIGVATYEIAKTLPKKLKDQLPSPEAIARLLENIRGWSNVRLLPKSRAEAQSQIMYDWR